MGTKIKTSNGECIKLRNSDCVVLNISIPITVFGCDRSWVRIWRLDTDIKDIYRKPDIRLISDLIQTKYSHDAKIILSSPFKNVDSINLSISVMSPLVTLGFENSFINVDTIYSQTFVSSPLVSISNLSSISVPVVSLLSFSVNPTPSVLSNSSQFIIIPIIKPLSFSMNEALISGGSQNNLLIVPTISPLSFNISSPESFGGIVFVPVVSMSISVTPVAAITDQISENSFYEGVIAREDAMVWMDLRSQSGIDAHDEVDPPDNNTAVTYEIAPVGGARVRTRGSLAGTDVIFIDFTSRIKTGHLICVHDYYYASGSNSWDLHHSLNTTHKWNMLGFEAGKLNITITNSGTTANVTDVAHSMYTGNVVVISGATQAAYNGTFTITVTGPDTYTYTMLSDPGGSATGTPVRGSNDRRRLEQRYNGYGGNECQVDTRPYGIGAATTGVGAGSDRITPWATNSVPAGQWHRILSETKMLDDTPKYSLRIILEDSTQIVVYDDVPCTLLVSQGGLDRWSPLWSNTSLAGEVVTITNSGLTAIVAHSGHELEIGDTIQLNSERDAVQPEYNGSKIVASVIDLNTYTYSMTGDPGGPATPTSANLGMLIYRTHGYIRNCAVCWSSGLIDNTPFIVAPLPYSGPLQVTVPVIGRYLPLQLSVDPPIVHI